MALNAEDEKIKNLTLAGAGLLILQNAFVFLFSISNFDNDEYVFKAFEAIADNEFVYLLDIAGFVVLGIAFYQLNVKWVRENNVFAKNIGTAAYGLFAWVGLRFIWQFILFDDSSSDVDFEIVAITMIISAVALFVAGYNLNPVDKKYVAFYYYTLFNLIATITIAGPFINEDVLDSVLEITQEMDEEILLLLTFRLKLIVVPIIGIIAFYNIIKEYIQQPLQRVQ